ncbi:terminase [Cryobacterium melibiosiphilum]|uniref:Terminase n=1 Tax=Cryobacterium melibiosiphilum TaxID=995039 RepID=A0A3A5MDF6_9MICO|nr:terminase [Cryobacterium melibiosiphilum]
MWTKPLRPLTRETSMGFEVVDFALMFLRVTLYPWQVWFLIHALEIHDDGTYRFKRVIGLVARQNGKTKLITVLAAWWLFVDSDRFPEDVHPRDFKVLGTAQNLDIARDAWAAVGRFCDPLDDESIPALSGSTEKISGSHGFEALILKNKTVYEIRAANRGAGRGKSAARVIMDELREQRTWDAWAAISQTTKAVFNSQLIGISNAGDSGSVVLLHQRKAALAFIEAWESMVESGVQDIEDFANGHDTSLGIFEWSAPDACAPDDVQGILQANPSIGHGVITLDSIRADREGMPDREYRTEVLCQWVTAAVATYLDNGGWIDCADAPDEINEGSTLAEGSQLVLGIDTSGNRAMSFLSVAGYRDDGLIHGEVIAQRAGMLWVPAVVAKICEKFGITHIAIQARGCPAAEFVEPLRELGFTIVEISGMALGSSAGRIRDRVRDRTIRHRSQGLLDIAVSGGVTKRLGEVQVWDRTASVVDIAPLVALSNALYGLETLPSADSTASYYEDNDLMVL